LNNFSFNITNCAIKVPRRRNYIACTGNIQQSLNVPCILYFNFTPTRGQKFTSTLYMSTHYNPDITLYTL